MAAVVETLIECSCGTVGEGPHWDDQSQTLLYVDIIDGSLHRWSAATGRDEKHTFGKFLLSYFMDSKIVKRWICNRMSVIQ